MRNLSVKLFCGWSVLPSRTLPFQIDRSDDIGIRNSCRAAAAAEIRGFEELKLQNAAAVREWVAKRLEALEESH